MDLIHIPRHDEWRREIEQYSGELAALFDEREHLQNVVLPNIEREYQCVLGELEYEKFAQMVELQKTRRTIELMQSYLNRKQVPDMTQIEQAIQTQFAEWQAKIAEMAASVERARIESEQGRVATSEETAECRSLFRGIVKQLHPDSIGEPTEGQKALWLQAQEAYKYFDIEELRAIALIVDTKLPPPEITSEEHHARRVASLRSAIAHLRQEITDIRSRRPYVYRSLLIDAARVQQMRDTLTSEIADCHVQLQYYTIILSELRKDWTPS